MVSQTDDPYYAIQKTVFMIFLAWEIPEKFYKEKLVENLVSLYSKIEKECRN